MKSVCSSGSDVYVKHCLSLISAHEWQKKFREGRTSLQDDSLVAPKIEQIDGLIREAKESQRHKFVFKSALAMAPCIQRSLAVSTNLRAMSSTSTRYEFREFFLP